MNAVGKNHVTKGSLLPILSHPPRALSLIVKFPFHFSHVLLFRVTLFAAFPPFSPPVRHPKHSPNSGGANLLTFSSRITSTPLTKFAIHSILWSTQYQTFNLPHTQSK